MFFEVNQQYLLGSKTDLEYGTYKNKWKKAAKAEPSGRKWVVVYEPCLRTDVVNARVLFVGESNVLASSA